MKKKYIEAGRIVGTHGLRGEVRIDTWCDSAEFLSEFETLYRGRDRIPMHRFVERKDVENTIVYLLSEDSSYLTGQFIILSGGNMMC